MNIQAMMKQAQQMQKQMLKTKEEIDNTTFTGSVNSISLTKTSTNSNYDVYELKIPHQTKTSTYTFLNANNNNKTVKKLEIYLSILATD